MFYEIFFMMVLFLLFSFLSVFLFKYYNKKDNLKSFEKFFSEVNNLSENQQQLFGGIKNLSEVQNNSNTNLLKYFENRLNEIQNSMTDKLSGSASHTAKSLGSLQERLVKIDSAQNKIEKLSNNVLSLQDILSNKQLRGNFGEIQLNDIISKALPPNSYDFQVILSNGKRVDCLINLPYPPGPISIDSKFPLEAYERMVNAKGEFEKKNTVREFKLHIRDHIKAISKKYIISGETAEGALMFLPSEAIYAELHSNFTELVRESFDERVWIVSPTTCMATLNTMRAILNDSKLKDEAHKVGIEIKYLIKDVNRLAERSSSLLKHFNMAQKDIEEIEISAKKTLRRADKLDNLDFIIKNDTNNENIKSI